MPLLLYEQLVVGALAMSIPIYPILSGLSGLLPIAAGIYVLRLLRGEMAVLFLYSVVAMIADALLFVLAIRGVNNLWLIHIFTPIQYGFLLWVLSGRSQPPVKKALRLTIPFFAGFWVIAVALIEQTRQFNTISGSIKATLLVLAAIYILFEINRQGAASLLKDPFFWIASAVLLYFGATVLVYALSNVLLNISNKALRLAFSFKSIIDIVANFLYAGGFLCLRRR